MIEALTDVTLCAADSLHPQLAARALTRSMLECRFGDAILFSDVAVSGPFRSVIVPALRSRADYSRFILRQLAPYISTPFALVVQWDGYVISGAAWRPAFTAYDYIGAPWPWHTDGMNVGNGGFSLRSKVLLEITAAGHIDDREAGNEDELICRVHRRSLERRFGIRFAPELIASQFSYERSVPTAQTFGFHGFFNMWRHVEDAEMVAIASQLQPSAVRSREFIELLVQYVALRKFGTATALFSCLKAIMTPDEVRALARESLRDDAVADACVSNCERWQRPP